MSMSTSTSRWSTNICTITTITTSTTTLQVILQANRMPTGTDMRGLGIPIGTTPTFITVMSTKWALRQGVHCHVDYKLEENFYVTHESLG